MSYYRNPVATQRRASYFNPPDPADYAMLSFVSVTELERVTGAAFRATSAPARMPSAVMVVTLDEMPVKSAAKSQEGNSSADAAQNSPAANVNRFICGIPDNPAAKRQQEQREHREYRAMMEARKQEIIWQKYDAGMMTAADFEPMTKPKEFIQAPRQHEYHGGYYGSYNYYSRNR